MLYLYLKNIDKDQLVWYIFIVILISIVVTRVSPTPLTVLSLLSGLFIVYLINERAVAESTIYSKRIREILETPIINSVKHENLHLDSEIVSFLDFLKEYYTYNYKLYNSLLKTLDNFLKLKQDISMGSVNFHQDYDTLLSLKPKILNTYHDFIYTVPHAEASLDKFHNGMKTLLTIINGHLNTANKIVLNRSKSNGVTTETKFHYRLHPKPANAGSMDKYHH
jgi:hypothetical protein